MTSQPVPETPADKEDNWGYDLYPERRGETHKPKWWQIAMFGSGQTNIEKTTCERNVYNCFQNSKKETILIFCYVKQLVNFVRSSGQTDVQCTQSIWMVTIVFNIEKNIH